MELLKNAYPGLKSTYETPHICGKCMGHIGTDWSFCPECGTPTGLTAEDVRQYQTSSSGKPINVVPCVPGDTVYDRRGQEWQITASELLLVNGRPKWIFRCGHMGTEDYCALYEDEILTAEDAKATREAFKTEM